MKTILEVIKLSAEFLEKKEILRAKREAEWLISYALGKSRMDLFLQFDQPLTEDEMQKCREVIRRRSLKEPFEYIVGTQSFAQVQLEINRSALIARCETELLVEKVIGELKNQDCIGKTLCDLCTGSAAIACAIKKRLPDLKVVASDISKPVLDLACLNAKKNGVEIEFYLGNLFEPFSGQKFDFFIANPPYVSEKEYKNLPKEVKEFEPKEALIAGPDGLFFYQKIATALGQYLHESAKAWLEIGETQGESVKKIFENNGFLAHVEKDLAGKDRFLLLNKIKN